jgi:hypothetical protein
MSDFVIKPGEIIVVSVERWWPDLFIKEEIHCLYAEVIAIDTQGIRCFIYDEDLGDEPSPVWQQFLLWKNIIHIEIAYLESDKDKKAFIKESMQRSRALRDAEKRLVNQRRREAAALAAPNEAPRVWHGWARSFEAERRAREGEG